jgi:hypothetical protein
MKNCANLGTVLKSYEKQMTTWRKPPSSFAVIIIGVPQAYYAKCAGLPQTSHRPPTPWKALKNVEMLWTQMRNLIRENMKSCEKPWKPFKNYE